MRIIFIVFVAWWTHCQTRRPKGSSSSTSSLPCDVVCWGPAVESEYSSMESVAQEDGTQSMIQSIEDWYEANYLGYYIYEMDYGKLYDENNEKHVKAVQMWQRFNLKLEKILERGYSFEDYRRERLLRYGDVGKEIHGYEDIDQVDLSFDAYVLKYYASVCYYCSAFYDALEPYVAILKILGTGAVTISVGIEADYLIYHTGFAVGVALSLDTDDAGLFVSIWSGVHFVEVGVEGMVDAAYYIDYSKIEGSSYYVNINAEGEEIDFGFSAIWTSDDGLIGIAASFQFGPSYGYAAEIGGGADFTAFIPIYGDYNEIVGVSHDARSISIDSSSNLGFSSKYIFIVIGVSVSIIAVVIATRKINMYTKGSNFEQESTPLLSSTNTN